MGNTPQAGKWRGRGGSIGGQFSKPSMEQVLGWGEPGVPRTQRSVSSWNLPPPVPWDENAIHALLSCHRRVPRKTATRPCRLLRAGPLGEGRGPGAGAGSWAHLLPPCLSAPSSSLHWPYCLLVTRGQPRAGLLDSGGGGPARAAGGQGASLSSSAHRRVSFRLSLCPPPDGDPGSLPEIKGCHPVPCEEEESGATLSLLPGLHIYVRRPKPATAEAHCMEAGYTRRVRLNLGLLTAQAMRKPCGVT